MVPDRVQATCSNDTHFTLFMAHRREFLPDPLNRLFPLKHRGIERIARTAQLIEFLNPVLVKLQTCIFEIHTFPPCPDLIPGTHDLSRLKERSE